MVLKTFSLGCGVWASLMLFLCLWTFMRIAIVGLVPVPSLKLAAVGHVSTWMGDRFSVLLVSVMAL